MKKERLVKILLTTVMIIVLLGMSINVFATTTLDDSDVIDNAIIENTIAPIADIAIHSPFWQRHFLFTSDKIKVSIAIPSIIQITVVIPVSIPVE